VSTVIYTDSHDPKGRTIRYNVDDTTRNVLGHLYAADEHHGFLEIPNEDGGDPIFVNPDHIVSIAPKKED